MCNVECDLDIALIDGAIKIRIKLRVTVRFSVVRVRVAVRRHLDVVLIDS